jgi:hypothetical protein
MAEWKDPIVEEVRAIRDAYAKRFNYDIKRIVADLIKKQEARAAAAAGAKKKAAKNGKAAAVSKGGGTKKRKAA